MRSYYDILGVPRDAPLSEIKRIYRKLTKAWHPDRFTDPDDKEFAEEKLKEINEAYEVLKDEEKRKRYDEEQREKFEKEHGPTVQKPKLVVSTKLIDFGEIEHGETVSQVFWIDNQGGPGHDLDIQFEPSNFGNFFKWKLIPNSNEAGKEFPIKFEIKLDTLKLELGRRYEWKITIRLDEEVLEVKLLLRNIFRIEKASLNSKPTAVVPPKKPHKVNILNWKGSKFLLWLGTLVNIVPLIFLPIGNIENVRQNSSDLTNLFLGFIFIGFIGLLPVFNFIIGLQCLIVTRNLKFPEKLEKLGGQAKAGWVMYSGTLYTLVLLGDGIITLVVYLFLRNKI